MPKLSKLLYTTFTFSCLTLSACNGGHNQTDATSNITNNSISQEISSAKIYRVGPTQSYTNLKQVSGLLQPGDTVFVDGDAEYIGGVSFSNNGTESQPISIIGVSINGKQPIIRADTKSNQNLLVFYGNHYILDNFEVVGNMSEVSNKALMTTRGINQISNDLTIRHCRVHNARNGIMASDLYSGNLTIEYSEVYSNGYAEGEHNIYIASDRVRVPNSVTTIRFNYIHDSLKGAGLKTRTSRNEIYYNWFANNAQSEVDIYGADLGEGSDPIYDKNGNITGYSSDKHVTQEELRQIDPFYAENYLREDTDFVGNVVISNNKIKSLTIGGDGGSGGPTRNGTSFGRYRFVNNTFVNNFNPSDGRSYTGQIKFGVGSLEFYNNIFYNQYGTSIGFYFNDYNANNDPHQTNSDLRWSNGRQIVARNNWFKTGSKLPSEFLASSLSGSEPGFFAANQNDYHLSVNNPLLTSGTTLTTNIFDDAIYFSNIGGNYVADYAFINPLLAPEFYPLVPGESQPVLRDPNLHSVGAF